MATRLEVMAAALDDIMNYLHNKGEVAILDGTNFTRRRRQMIRNRVAQADGFEILWIESICEDPKVWVYGCGPEVPLFCVVRLCVCVCCFSCFGESYPQEEGEKRVAVRHIDCRVFKSLYFWVGGGEGRGVRPINLVVGGIGRWIRLPTGSYTIIVYRGVKMDRE